MKRFGIDDSLLPQLGSLSSLVVLIQLRLTTWPREAPEEDSRGISSSADRRKELYKAEYSELGLMSLCCPGGGQAILIFLFVCFFRSCTSQSMQSTAAQWARKTGVKSCKQKSQKRSDNFERKWWPGFEAMSVSACPCPCFYDVTPLCLMPLHWFTRILLSSVLITSQRP